MKKARRILTALLAACMLGTGTPGAVTANAVTSVTTEAQSSKPVVKATIAGEKIKLTWSAISGAEKYRVYKYENDKLKKLTDVTKCRVILTGAKASSTYILAVSAYVNGGWTKITKNDLVKITLPGSSAIDGEEMLSLWTSDAAAKTSPPGHMQKVKALRPFSRWTWSP